MEWLAYIVPALFSWLSGQQSSAQQVEAQKEANQQNIELMHEAWDREDNAVQRRVKDLEAAGLSPTLAAGSAAASSSPITVSPTFGSGAANSLLSGLGSATKSLQAGALYKMQEMSMEKDFAVKDQQIASMEAQAQAVKDNANANVINAKTRQALAEAQEKVWTAQVENMKKNSNFNWLLKTHQQNLKDNEYRVNMFDKRWFQSRGYPSVGFPFNFMDSASLHGLGNLDGLKYDSDYYGGFNAYEPFGYNDYYSFE